MSLYYTTVVFVGYLAGGGECVAYDVIVNFKFLETVQVCTCT